MYSKNVGHNLYSNSPKIENFFYEENRNETLFHINKQHTELHTDMKNFLHKKEECEIN